MRTDALSYASRSFPPFNHRALSFNDGFPGADGPIPFPWNYTSGIWAIVSEKAVCTPGLSAELASTIGFAADQDWTKGTGWAIAAGVATHIATGAGNLTQAVGVIGGWYRIGYDITSISASSLNALFGDNAQLGKAYTGLQSNILSFGRAITSTALGIRAGAATVASVDNATIKRLTLADLFCTVPNQRVSANISAATTIVADSFAGVVGWLDSYTVPANFIVCYHNGTNLIVDKCVGGVYTNLVNAAAAYSAGATIILKGNRSGSDLLVTAFYNGNQVGTEQTVSDAGIVSNTRHGMFSVYSGNTLDSFSVAAFS